MKIILASNSPRRKNLLSYITRNFDVIPSNIDEILEEGLTSKEQAVNLSYIKAKSIYDSTEGDRIIIGSDTIVVKNGIIYGKPKTKEHAKDMIRSLISKGRTHQIITGLCILVNKEGIYKEYKICDEVKVYLKNISDDEIDRWIETGKAMDKAGAYGIQEEFSVFVEKIDGNYTSAVGLPVHIVYDILKKYL